MFDVASVELWNERQRRRMNFRQFHQTQRDRDACQNTCKPHNGEFGKVYRCLSLPPAELYHRRHQQIFKKKRKKEKNATEILILILFWPIFYLFLFALQKLMVIRRRQQNALNLKVCFTVIVCNCFFVWVCFVSSSKLIITGSGHRAALMLVFSFFYFFFIEKRFIFFYFFECVFSHPYLS